jgi:hypothetical protein
MGLRRLAAGRRAERRESRTDPVVRLDAERLPGQRARRRQQRAGSFRGRLEGRVGWIGEQDGLGLVEAFVHLLGLDERHERAVDRDTLAPYDGDAGARAALE